MLLADKPAGVTSHDVVAAVRRALGRGVKVGHAGTLDPFATGLLVVLVGRATRVQRFVMRLRKVYEVEARFGWVSSTGDPEGVLTGTGAVPAGKLVLPVGVVRQRPPAYSAVKVDGRRAYALARAGEEVELPEREVTVHRFEERWRSGDRRGFEVECSSGTYVRSLIADLGDAYCTALRRTRIGPFDVQDAHRIDVDDAHRVDLGGAELTLIPLDDALGFIPAVAVTDEAGRGLAHGRRVPLPVRATVPAAVAGGRDAVASEPLPSASEPAVVRAIDSTGLVCLAEIVGPAGDAAELRPSVGLRG